MVILALAVFYNVKASSGLLVIFYNVKASNGLLVIFVIFVILIISFCLYFYLQHGSLEHWC